MTNGGTNGNGSALNIKSILSAASWVVQAALIGLVSLFATWISNQNEVNTQTAISLNTLTSKITDREQAYRDLLLKLDRVEERQREIELQIAKAGKTQ